MPSAKTQKTPDTLFDTLVRVQEALDTARVPFQITFGTLLGAVREGNILAWDDDFDLLLEPEQVEPALALGPVLAKSGITLERGRRPATHLALNLRGLTSFDSGAITIFRDGRKFGDFFTFHRFADGIRRRYDFEAEVYWCPHSAFPDFFLEETRPVTLRGRTFPAMKHAEKWLEGVYGLDWKTPRKSRNTGGTLKPGENLYGHQCAPKLVEEIAWCVAQGWQRGRARGEHDWPRELGGAGPRGPVPRTEANSQSLWWRDLDELVEHF